MRSWRRGSATVPSSGSGCTGAGRISSFRRADVSYSGSHSPFLHHDSFDDGFPLVHPASQQPGDHRADDRGQPEQPELADILATGEQRRSGAARRIDRGVGDRDRHEMDQGQSEADRDAGKTCSGTLRRAPDDDEEEKERHHHFHKKASPEAIFAGAEITIAVGSKAAGDPAWLARCDDPQDRGSDYSGDHLSDDVGNNVTGGAASRAPQADRDRRVEMAARNVPDGISHRQHRQPECERNTQKADPEAWKSCGQDCRTAAAEHQPKRAKELGDNPPRHVVFHRSPPKLTNYTLPVEDETLKNLERGVRP